jgi:ABC-type branched-subunit amino acid transport system ATPase component/sugar phosphate permease
VIDRLRRVVGNESLVPLAFLFLLNAFDELDRTAFGILTPEIRDAFDLDNQGILSIIALVSAIGLGLQPFIGFLADRRSRVRIAVSGAAGWGVFSLLTGFAPTVAILVAVRCGSALGRIVNEPTHNSLLADYYRPEHRPGVYGLHRAANSVGQIIGPLAAGSLAAVFGWRAPFVVLALPTIVLVIAASRYLREPVRGRHERSAMGAEDLADIEETPPSFSEGWRICNEVRSVKRIWVSLPFLAIALIGLGSLTNIYYEDTFGLNEAERGVVAALAEPFQLVGIAVFIPLSLRLVAQRGPGVVLRLISITGSIGAVLLIAFALAPNVVLAVATHIALTSVIGAVGPGIYATLAQVLPPRARALGFSIGSLWVLPGLVVLVIIGGVADANGIRTGLLVLVPVFLIGTFLIASAGAFVDADIAKVRAASVARAEVQRARTEGRQKLLLVKELDVAYGNVQVLFGVDFEIEQGEVVALLGTNGAGKSTLLRAISGLQPARAGAVIFDGEDITFATPQQVARQGVIQVPGGKGVFPGLSVAENLKLAGWLYQKDEAYVSEAIDRVTSMFPILKERWDQPAGLLSGGEQQMVTLAQAFIAKPRLLMIDELSLGLAPVIVEQLLGIVRAIRDQGTTLILVEQSVNVALTVAETAYFMEKGEIRFKGPTAELLARPDVLRSVFLEGAAASDTTETDLEPAASRRRRGEPLVTRRIDHERPALEVRGLVKRFGGISATNDVSFALGRGEILGFIGPNGAGKTTLFDQISGYLDPDAGSILLGGLDVTGAGPDARARLGLGRSFQDARLFPSLTVTDTLKLSLERRLPVRDPVAAALHLPVVKETERALASRVDELIELMGLQAFADKFVGELSTGSRRIVDLACVLAHEPDVILFDEPSSGIAQAETEALGPLLRRIRDATDASLLIIEHDMPLIQTVSDRLVALDLGRVLVTGPPTDVINHPAVIEAYLGTDEAAIARSGRS